ncbi:hypothetical protein QQP08_008933 [Theobroma cacao]|nr:hypothetical protein QQP08_008933 [Theobroma cacao]
MPMPQNQLVTTIPSNGSLQSNAGGAAAAGMPMRLMPMPSPPVKVVPTGPWTTELFDCMEDPTNAVHFV